MHRCALSCPYCLDDDSVGQNSVCDDVYIGVNDGFSECDVSTGGGTGEDDGKGEDVADDGVGEDDGDGEDVEYDGAGEDVEDDGGGEDVEDDGAVEDVEDDGAGEDDGNGEDIYWMKTAVNLR